MATLLSSEKPLSSMHDYLLLDLDGVCYRGSQSVPYAAQGIALARHAGMRTAFLTNNSTRTAQAVADKLTEHGIPAHPHEIYTSSRTAVRQLCQHVPPGAKVLALGTEGLFAELAQTDLRVVTSADEHPEAVIHGLSADISYRELSEAALAIQAGAQYIATNLDATTPQDRGNMLGNGAMVAAVVCATGVQPLSSGKPAPDMYVLAMEETGARNPLCVGDRLDTDIAGANAAGFASLHVLTGVVSARDVLCAPPEYRPSYLGIDLSDVNRPAPEVICGTRRWCCGASVVENDAAQILLNGVPFTVQCGHYQITLNDYRALSAAFWALYDRGEAVEMSQIPQCEVVRDEQ
ncbi:HAD-IIA family hydrolase [Trueperella sp. LYQ143]|uniref:HAD-IIA family hydrolase n=1 Tax=unclassified Trueperella TaxID=2630174 RepID=UPI00398379B4